MITLDGETLRITPQEELTIYRVETFATTILTLLPSAKSLHVNLSFTDKIDTAGFQILIALQKSCEALNIPFVIDGIQASAKNFIELFGYEQEFDTKGVS